MHDELRDHQIERGGIADRTATAGPLVADFGDAGSEYRAAREAAVVFDVSDRTSLELSGPDPKRFVHAYCTHDVLGLPDGGGREAFVTNVKGRVLGHVWIAVDGGSVRIDSWPGAAHAIVGHLARYALLADVEIVDRTPEWAKLFVCGPEAPRHLGLADLPPLGFRRIEAFGGSVAMQRTDWFGNPGFLLSLPADRAIGVWDGLVAAGVVPAGRRVFEPLRIENRLPRYGVDVSDEHLAQEAARTASAISFTKGCYLGQEPIHRLQTMGHTNRELRVLHLAGELVPEPGTPIVSGEKEVGTLTSAAAVPGEGRSVGLAVVRVAPAAVGSEVSIAGRAARVSL